MAARYRCGLHDDMGLGKTRTAIMGLDNLGARRGIIVCKASIKENWRRELIRWAGLGRRVRKANDLTDCNDFLKYYYDTMIVSYEMMTRWRGFMMSRLSLLEFMIIDEAHNVKNPNAQRTKALKGENCDGIGAISQFAIYGWELTGTPIPNDPLDLYSFLKFCGKLGSMQQNDFACEYFSVSPGRYSSRQTVRPEKQILFVLYPYEGPAESIYRLSSSPLPILMAMHPKYQALCAITLVSIGLLSELSKGATSTR